MIPKYLQSEETVKEKSLKQEKRVQRQLASGALWHHKGDIISDVYMVECKIGNKQVVVTKRMLEKIFTEAVKDGRLPALFIEVDGYILTGEVYKK